MPRRRGLKLTPQVADRIVAGVRKGVFMVHIAASCGTTVQSVANWTIRGEQAMQKAADTGSHIPEREQVFVDLVVRIKEAEAEFIEGQLKRIDMAGPRPVFQKNPDGSIKRDEAGAPVLSKVEGDWKALAWRLENMHPKKFGPRSAVHHTGEVGVKGAVSLVVSSMTDEELKKRLSNQDALMSKLKELDGDDTPDPQADPGEIPET